MIDIKEAGVIHEIRVAPFPTSAFHSSARMNGNRQKRTDAKTRMPASEREGKKRRTECSFCGKQHNGYCYSVSNTPERVSIMKNKKLL
ncbi:hypothetical protein DPMN_118482 [Dreissena polymorpha]|uniref:Uncharacterized protein n=1 Tax=Dreissena polymorpha TaxID=45954 RepID=A0A9D4GHH3_DREPO|nr:hypothetical protein DPMN_118482 [Dreissena polymorpha]